ncbi:MAG: cell division protein ZapA [Deltaproteobacteria bacterium]|nr:cell division protein ZapA [Deltaproteobacteria bacterium]NIS76467.1 cell division protein ZapA [Deltaproteobacteria bacterium]
MKKVIDINILGYKLSISTDKDERYVEELTSYLNGKLREIKRDNKTITNMDQLILTSLTIADEMLIMRRELENTKGKVKELDLLLDEKLGHIQG